MPKYFQTNTQNASQPPKPRCCLLERQRSTKSNTRGKPLIEQSARTKRTICQLGSLSDSQLWSGDLLIKNVYRVIRRWQLKLVNKVGIRADKKAEFHLTMKSKTISQGMCDKTMCDDSMLMSWLIRKIACSVFQFFKIINDDELMSIQSIG